MKRILIGLALLASTAIVYATASYPASVKSFSTKLAGQTISSAHVNDIQDEIVAIEGALLNGFTHTLKPTVAAANDLGTTGLPWGMAHVRGLNLDASSTLTIASGVVTVLRSYHALDTEGAAATDDLDTLTAGTGVAEGFVLTVRAANTAHVVTLKDGTGNLLLNGDCLLTSTDATLLLIYDGTNWRELSRSIPRMTLLKANSGTDTTAAATNLDTIAISGLTAKDTLKVYVTIGSTTAATGAPRIYNSTDSVDMLVSGSGVTAGTIFELDATIRQRQTGNTKVVSSGLYSANDAVSNANSTMRHTQSTFTTAWTGSWTLALRHNGVTATGTCDWSWAVYKIAGQ